MEETSNSLFSDNTRKKREIYSFFMGVLAQFFMGISNIQLKTYRTFFPEYYSTQSLTFWRSFSICIVGYIMVKRKKERITPLNEVKNKFWFYLRNFGNYIFIVLWIIELTYFRVGTCQSIASCSPIIVLILSSVILHEPFYIRYIFGVILCLIGAIMIVSNDKKDKSSNLKNKTVFDMFIGLTIAISHMTFVAFSHFGQKMLCNEKMVPEVQNYYMGLFNAIPAFFVMIMEKKTGISNILYVLYAFSNGIIFYLANYCVAEALNIMAMNKFIPMTYLRVVFIFVFSFILLGEKIYFTDVVGSALIIGFQVYNVCYPIHQAKHKNDNSEISLPDNKDNIKVNFIKKMGE